jgi:hypothetical protein
MIGTGEPLCEVAALQLISHFGSDGLFTEQHTLAPL